MLKIYNTLSGKKELFQPRKRKRINLFVCGPTVYDFSHIGHARTYIAFDMIAKYLKAKGCHVFYLQNITDIDDKIIARAKEKNISPGKLAKDFEKKYLKDMKSLKIDSVTKYARAADFIKEIISQVKRLLKKGYAYQIEDGIYYDISKFKNYGKLSKRTVLQAEDALSRIDQAKEKRNRGDFCLWKFSKQGEPMWDFETGKYLGAAGPASAKASAGKPGWHIEDTAITEKFFGPQYDIHGGAKDLIFPHHEAEIAQMEAISGKKPMVKYWLHTGFLTVDGQKMSKSLGNFITIRDFLKKYSPRLLRFLVIKNYYRSPIDYSDKAVLQAEKELERIDEFIEKLKKSDFQKTPGVDEKTPGVKTRKSDFLNIRKFRTQFEKAMEDDFNTPKAIAAIFELISQSNSLMDENLFSQSDAKKILEFFREVDEFLNFIFWQKPAEKSPPKLLRLVKQRQKYRMEGNWQKADEIRARIKELGWLVEDTQNGPKLKKN